MDITINTHETHNPSYDIAQSIIDKDTMICASRNVDSGVVQYEVYRGENYVFSSIKRSYSRVYKEFKKLPMKYQLQMSILERAVNKFIVCEGILKNV